MVSPASSKVSNNTSPAHHHYLQSNPLCSLLVASEELLPVMLSAGLNLLLCTSYILLYYSISFIYLQRITYLYFVILFTYHMYILQQVIHLFISAYTGKKFQSSTVDIKRGKGIFKNKGFFRVKIEYVIR